jgi:hypothetical protein
MENVIKLKSCCSKMFLTYKKKEWNGQIYKMTFWKRENILWQSFDASFLKNWIDGRISCSSFMP